MDHRQESAEAILQTQFSDSGGTGACLLISRQAWQIPENVWEMPDCVKKAKILPLIITEG
jgi:hypothetical protein